MEKQTITAYIMFGICAIFFVASLLLGLSNFVFVETIQGIFGSGELGAIHIIFLICLGIAVICGIIGCCNYNFKDDDNQNSSYNSTYSYGEYDDGTNDFSTNNSSYPYESVVTEDGAEVEFNTITGTMTESSDGFRYEKHWDGSVTHIDEDD